MRCALPAVMPHTHPLAGHHGADLRLQFLAGIAFRTEVYIVRVIRTERLTLRRDDFQVIPLQFYRSAGNPQCRAAPFPRRPFLRYRSPLLGRQPLAGVCLRGAKADSPLPHDGPLDPLPTVGTGRVAPAISCEWRNR